ncbi:replication protein A 70 kDa DNA-binding subunit E-like [Helianthus annuus]|uniref:replication protein A 70 kDa DNA-binding subunit E-like n=1 Tax=Helianthus annuus TaxID=4232 RepID=UPI000B8F0A1F|nr:replication protein A 70 kDa DNA-binding subunit E-like [Helianthus annuus]
MENCLQMEVAKVSMLNDLNIFSNNYSIRVKIVSMSRKMMNQNKNETYRLDMIFMDEMGTTIQASCLHKVLERFKDFLQLDQCLLITKPSLAANKSSAKYTNRNDKISLYFYTYVEKCLDWSGPKYRFNFVNLKDVVQNKIEVNTVIDWIGYVEVCFNLEDTTKKDGSKGKILNLRVEDLEGQKCLVTLWDAFAIDMFAYMNDKKREKHVVILCHFGMVNLYKGKRGVANGFEFSRFFIDTDIEEISSFRKRYKKISVSSSSNEHVGSYVISSIEDEFLNNPDFMLIGFLGTILTTKKVLVLGTITAICTDKLWYYNGCNHCKSSVEERFVTKENVDGSFDVDHTKALVINSGEIPNPYPEIFDTLIGKKYAFIINVKDYNIEQQVENYGIVMATNDDEILATLYAKFNLNQHEQSESLDVPDSCSLSTLVDLMKAEMSCNGDNVTPASKALVGNKNPSSDETKRNIREVCDVDEALGCSSTKRRMSDELYQDEDAGVSKLLIPKIEK